MVKTNSGNIVFLSNELLDPSKRYALGLPATFLSFGFIEAKMFKHFRNQGTFAIRHGGNWGNEVVYGAVYSLQDFDFHIRNLDSYHQCSKSYLGRNHINDIHIREKVLYTPIRFDNVDELERLKYWESKSYKVYAYFGNSKHPKIKQRLNKTASYRIVDGVDKSLIKQIREVLH